MPRRIRTGCCGFPVSRKRYFEAFNAVGVEKTFYQMPGLTVAQKWRKEAPEGFEYTMKAWQLITHGSKSPTYKKLKFQIPEGKERNYGSFKPTEEVMEAWERTAEIAKALDAKVIVFQCPPGFEPSGGNKKNLRRFFANIKKEGFTLAWEPRGEWTGKDIEPVCKDLDLVHIVDPFKSSQIFGDIFYYRLHGIGGYRYKYTEDDLERLKRLAKGKKEGYVMFNNVYMFEDALKFKELA